MILVVLVAVVVGAELLALVIVVAVVVRAVLSLPCGAPTGVQIRDLQLAS